MKAKPFTVVVEGNMGSGKSTFLEYLRKHESVEIHTEPIDLWRNLHGHNLLGLQYEDPKKWSATLQSYVQLTMLKLHMKESAKSVKIMERSIYSARYCFVEYMMQSKMISEPSGYVLDEWFQFMTKNMDINIDLVVYLKTTPEIVYQRILERNRREEKQVALEYIQELNKMHEKWFSKAELLPAPVLTLNGDLELNDFYTEVAKYLPYILNERRIQISANAEIIPFET